MMVAALRRWWWTHVRRHESELCDFCGRPYPFTWWAEPSLWLRFGPKPGTEYGLSCPSCLAERARAGGVLVEFRARPYAVRDGDEWQVTDETLRLYESDYRQERGCDV